MSGSAAADTNEPKALTVAKALETARNSQGDVDPAISQFLEQALEDLWGRLFLQPDTYIFTKEEFTLFNYYRRRYQDSEIARKAVQRFWDNNNRSG